MGARYTVPVSEAAERSGFSHQQILNRIRRKKLPAKKAGWVWLLTEAAVQQLEQTTRKK